MSRKILLATTGTYPDGMARTYRIHCYARSVQEAGGVIEVVSSKGQKKYVGKTFNFKAQHECINYTIIWNKGKFRHIYYDYLWAQLRSYVLLFYLIVNNRKFDVVWLYGMSLIPRLILIFACRILDKKIVLELNELPYTSDGLSKVARIPAVNKVLKKMTWRWVIPKLNGIVSISENLSKKVLSFNPGIPIIKIPILINFKESRFNDNCNKTKERYIFHAGSLSPQKDGIVKVFEAFCIAAKKLEILGIDLKFVITNKTAHKEVWSEITELLKFNGMFEKLEVTGYLSDEDLFCYLRDADVLVINKPNTLQNKYNFPTKLGDYLLSKTPVIVAAENKELNEYIQDGLNGVVVKPNDSDAIAKAIIRLCLDSEEGERLGQKGYETAIKYFSYNNYGHTLNKFFDSLYS